MAWRVKNRLTSGLLLAVYLLSTTASGLFHDHSHPLDSACSHQRHACRGHAGHEAVASVEDHGVQDHGVQDHDVEDHADELASGGGQERVPGDDDSVQHSGRSTDDTCVVCRFLGLSSLPIAVPALSARPELVATVNAIEPLHDSRRPELTLRTRAPPQVV
jgi:hypothetical protein